MNDKGVSVLGNAASCVLTSVSHPGPERGHEYGGAAAGAGPTGYR